MLSKRASIILTVALVVLISGFQWSHPQIAQADVIYISGHITSDQTWVAGDVYVIEGHTTVDSGVTLTIEAGTIVKFAIGKLMGVNGVLRVEGTTTDPVYITSLRDDTVGGDTNNDGIATVPDRGDWGHIAFFDSSVESESLIEHTVIRYGGYFYTGTSRDYYNCYQCTYLGTVRFTSASPTIRNNVIEYSEGYALSASVDSFPTVSGNSLSYNDGNGLEIRGGTLSAGTPTTMHWNNTDVVYVVTGHTTIATGVTLILDPGVMVKFANNKLMGVNGALRLEGTSTDPVYITSLRDDTVGGDTNNDLNGSVPDRGDWGHIAFFDNSVDSENLINYAVISYGGHFYTGTSRDYYDCYQCTYTMMVWADSAGLTMQNSVLEHSSGDGLRISYPDDSPNISVQYCTFRLNSGSGVRVTGP
ncbi:MAG: hypothetical protein JW963_00750 [Anaerolineales bacterium]|nr:hypothetical protein [Anaerolineales bacterium]